MSSDRPFTGPDADGFYWMEWTDAEGTDRIIIGETLAEAEAKAKKILGDDYSPDPLAPRFLH